MKTLSKTPNRLRENGDSHTPSNNSRSGRVKNGTPTSSDVISPRPVASKQLLHNGHHSPATTNGHMSSSTRRARPPTTVVRNAAVQVEEEPFVNQSMPQLDDLCNDANRFSYTIPVIPTSSGAGEVEIQANVVVEAFFTYRSLQSFVGGSADQSPVVVGSTEQASLTKDGDRREVESNQTVSNGSVTTSDNLEVPTINPNDCRLEVSVGRQLSAMGDEFMQQYGGQIDAIIDQLPQTVDNPFGLLWDVAVQLFDGKTFQWGRLIALLCFAYRFFCLRLRQLVSNALGQLCVWVIRLCREFNIFNLIAARGGWLSLFCSLVDDGGQSNSTNTPTTPNCSSTYPMAVSDLTTGLITSTPSLSVSSTPLWIRASLSTLGLILLVASIRRLSSFPSS